MEKWRPIFGFVGCYEVSSLGRVRRLKHAKGATVGHVLKPWHTLGGYNMVYLCKEGGRCPKILHRLVARAFIGPSNGLEVNHRNGNKDDNCDRNLEYVTRQANARHAAANGRMARGVRCRQTKLTVSIVREIRMMYATGDWFHRELAVMFGVTKGCITAVISRKTWNWL